MAKEIRERRNKTTAFHTPIDDIVKNGLYIFNKVRMSLLYEHLNERGVTLKSVLV